MQELDQLARSSADDANSWRLLDRVEVEADMMDAASRRTDDHVEVTEAANKVDFGGGGVFLAATVGHWLAAAGLADRVLHRAAETLEQLERRDAHVREECVDVTGDEQSDFHRPVPPVAFLSV